MRKDRIQVDQIKGVLRKGKVKDGIEPLPARIVAEVVHIEEAKPHGGMRAGEIPLTPLNRPGTHIHAPVLGQLPDPGEQADREASGATADIKDAAVARYAATLDYPLGFPLRRPQKMVV